MKVLSNFILDFLNFRLVVGYKDKCINFDIYNKIYDGLLKVGKRFKRIYSILIVVIFGWLLILIFELYVLLGG